MINVLLSEKIIAAKREAQNPFDFHLKLFNKY